jgi:hypothetical protein
MRSINNTEDKNKTLDLKAENYRKKCLWTLDNKNKNKQADPHIHTKP